MTDDDVQERIERYLDAHPDADVVKVLAHLGVSPEHRTFVEEFLETDDATDGPAAAIGNPDRFNVPVHEQCALPKCHNRRVNPHPDSLCAECWLGLDPDPQTTVDDHEQSDDRPAAEARAIAGDEQHDVNVREQSSEEPDDAGEFTLADAMASSEGLPDPTPNKSTSTSSAGGSIGMPTSALPLGQLDALSPAKRRRVATKRGFDWPTTDRARDQLFETIATVMREEDDRVVDAPTSLGKTHTVAATR